MRKILFTIAFLVALAFVAGAQTLRAGAFAGYTTSPDPSPEATQDGGKFFPGITASGEFRKGKRIEFRFAADASRTPQLPTLFTTDEGSHKPSFELRVHPQAVLNVGRIYFAAGVDTFYHFGLPNYSIREYSRSFGVNPTASYGVWITKNHNASFTYLFRDKGTDLYGYRVNYFYTLPKGFRVGVEANKLQFKERNRLGYVDDYYENDNVFKVSFEVPLFNGGYKH